MAFHVFGLTGGIASGKSLVARRFRGRGLPVVDADELAREAVTQGSPALAEIVREFGGEMLAPDGALDRPRLGALVFTDAGARARLNAVVHPRVRTLAREQLDRLAAAGEPLACYEVPLLFEVGLETGLRPVVVVSAPETLQIRRLMARNQLSEPAARARIAAQLPLEEKVRHADYVIDNSGSASQCEAGADQVLTAICEQLGVDASRYGLPQQSDRAR